MNKRRHLLLFICALTPFGSVGQQAVAPRRVGFLLSEPSQAQAVRLQSLRDGLRALGYVEGKNLVIDVRSAEGSYDRLPALAQALVRERMEVIVAFGLKALAATKEVTQTIPIVVPSMSDPRQVETGRGATRYANVVGSDNLNRQVYGKRLELLKESFPHIARVALLINPDQPLPVAVEASAPAAGKLKLQMRVFEARTAAELEPAFAAISASRMDALLVQQDTLFSSRAADVAALATRHKLPSAGVKEFAEAGGLIGYGVSDEEFYRRAAHFVDRLLKGAKPAELPIENAMKFELVLNARTAKSIGAAFPRSVLLRADHVIE